MSAPKFIIVKNKRLHLYEVYNTWKQALKEAKYYQKKYKCNYFILPYERFLTGGRSYALYMNKIYNPVRGII